MTTRTEPFLRLPRNGPYYTVDFILVLLATFNHLRNPMDPFTILITILLFTIGACIATWPTVATPSIASPSSLAEGDEALAEAALLAWKIARRAEKDPENQRVILRNAERIVEALNRCGVEVVSYRGRRIDAGSNVEVLDAVPGEYNRVIEESDPQVQRHGRLLHRAIVTIGNGKSTEQN